MLAPINLRFAELIQAVGLNKNAFAQSLGKTASVIQHLIDGRNKPGYDLLCKVFEVYPNVSKDWLMEGRGPMLLAGPLNGTSATVAPPAAPAVALKKAAGPPSLFAAQATEEAPVAPAAPLPAPAPVAASTALPGAPAVALAAPPAPTATPAAPAVDVAIGAALQTQHLLHQLALAELRNQHLLEQQGLLRQMVELAQRR